MKNDPPAPISTWETASSRTVAWPVSSSTPIVTWPLKRTRSAPTITVRRLTRSATVPPIAITNTCEMTRAAMITPRSVTDPVRSSTANARATPTTPSPRFEASVDANTQRRS